jgi:transposase InsO family protein
MRAGFRSSSEGLSLLHDPSRTASDEASLDTRALAALATSRNFSTETVRLLLRAKEILLLAMGMVLGEWRASRDPVSGAFAEHCQAEIQCRQRGEALEIISGRIRRMPPAHRKRYSPEERFQIVVFVRTYQFSHREAAELFMVDAQTIARWIAETTREPDRRTVGSLVKATPPLRAFSDVTRQLVAMLDSMRIGGSKRIAQMLVRARVKISRETVRRYRKAMPPLPAVPPNDSTNTHGVRAKRPNHVWMTDITTIPGFLRLWMFKLVVVLDVYSRFPLAFLVFSKEPTSEEIAQLVRSASDRFGKPTHFVTDRGAQFTGSTFAGTLRDLGTKQRFGAIGKAGSIAIIERLWRTLKDMLELRIVPPLSVSQLEERVDLGLLYYAAFRPHQGLGGATPAEIYFGLEPAGRNAAPPPRAGPATAATTELSFEVVYLDREQRLPLLIPKKLAA